MVETRLGVDFGHGTGVWVSYWMELRDGGKVPADVGDDDVDRVPFPSPRARC